MKNLLLGIIIGALLSSLCFTLTFQQKQISSIREKQNSIIKDINSLALRLGPLAEGKKKNK
jgi:hypothetical protein